jgi:transcriptional regulator PpsR
MKRAAGKSLVGELDATTASKLIEASSDLALVMDGEGTILDVVVGDNEVAKRSARHWIGQPWVQTVTEESKQKVEALLRDAHAAVAARWRQVNHPMKGGDDLPFLYSAVRLADAERSRHKGRLVALGRDLSNVVTLQRRLVEAQQAMERDYWRFREAETRYRHLFQSSSEAVLIVEGMAQRITEANPAAQALCAAAGRTKLSGAALSALFDAGSAEALQALVAAARSIGKNEPVRLTLADGRTPVSVWVSVFRQEEAPFLLVRMARLAVDPTRVRGAGKAALALARSNDLASTALSLPQAFVQNSPDGVVFTDPTGRVLWANRAFVTLAQISTDDQARGQLLDHWLGSTGVELGVLISNLRQHGSVSLFVTAVRGEYGALTDVEISASVLDTGESSVLAFCLRDINRRLKPPQAATAMPKSAGQLTQLVGRVPLREIVSDTTDLIEQLCIETALEMTGDNRASAASLLGLSRQSLYVKLRRYGLGDLAGEEDS